MNRSLRPSSVFSATVVSIIALAGLATPLAASAQPASTTMSQAQSSPTVPLVTATGSATVSRAPDQAVVMLGVATVGTTSTDAQDRLNTTLDKVVKAVKALNLPDLKVQTQWLSLQPVYEQVDYREQQRQPREPKIIGYNASNTIRVSVGDVNKAGSIIDAAIAAGANQVQGLSFELKDDRAAKDEALRSAAKDARSKAEAMADALGLRVVRIVEVQSGFNQQPRPMFRGRGVAMAVADAAPTVVEPGEVSITEQVTVSVEVAPL